ncbi:hypothetical protein PROVALCAL_00173 [Providencia alcalifaciens DSM 30120]|uniref:Uncharacterized protein n=1 Tax=Providencia alcalifaciens DSM 30120 TaxID=520999 RepID=B6XA26_9GAMM|nr:hypothetical protein PROVALCAL_00173 [Providencia alcalifaciens DSM 30120]
MTVSVATTGVDADSGVEVILTGVAVEPWFATGVLGVAAGVVSADAVPIKPIANRIEAVNLRISWPLLSYLCCIKKFISMIVPFID